MLLKYFTLVLIYFSIAFLFEAREQEKFISSKKNKIFKSKRFVYQSLPFRKDHNGALFYFVFPQAFRLYIHKLVKIYQCICYALFVIIIYTAYLLTNFQYSKGLHQALNVTYLLGIGKGSRTFLLRIILVTVPYDFIRELRKIIRPEASLSAFVCA